MHNGTVDELVGSQGHVSTVTLLGNTRNERNGTERNGTERLRFLEIRHNGKRNGTERREERKRIISVMDIYIYRVVKTHTSRERESERERERDETEE